MTITYPLNTQLNFNDGSTVINEISNEFIHPMLELQPFELPPIPVISHKLYLVPTTDPAIADGSVDPIFGPQPSSLAELPDVNAWSKSFVIGLIEIWAGKRPAMQSVGSIVNGSARCINLSGSTVIALTGIKSPTPTRCVTVAPINCASADM